MSSRPSSRRGRHWRRALLVGGLATCLTCAPAAAWADDGPPPDPLGGVTGPVGDVLGGVLDPGQGQVPLAPGTGDQPAPAAQQAPQQGGTPALDPAELEALLAQLQAQSPFPEGCAEGVQAAVEELVAELQAVDPEQLADPQNLDDLLTQLEDGLGSLQGGQAPELPDPAEYGLPDLAGAVEDLVAALQACLVAPETPEQPAPPAGGPAQPAQQPPAPPAAVPAAAPQPVSYPGYAPTGAAVGEDDGDGALVFLGSALVLLGGAGAAGHRIRTREARGEG